MTDEQNPNAKRWSDEAEEALKRTSEALKAAWEDSREARLSALEAAKEAAGRLGDAIDQGIAAAKETWRPPDRQQPDEPGPPQGDEEEE